MRRWSRAVSARPVTPKNSPTIIDWLQCPAERLQACYAREHAYWRVDERRLLDALRGRRSW